ncbi:GNAT family N-acetyltransferase [Paenibacillus sp. FA6]|uniref:GNAT family N-acetyltransferase n=1 Tax=Paenibacillus sp. FA6 TaxID=3413029 RepID=UPI003F65B6BA
MTTKLITDVEGLLSIKEDWERIERCDRKTTYYSTFHFNYCWWLTYGQNKNNQLFIICCYRDNEMVGIAPLMFRKIDKKLLKCNELRFIGKGDYFNFILDSSQFSALAIIKDIFKVIEDHASRWDRIEMTHIQMDTPLLRYLLRHDKYNPYVHYLTSSPRFDTEDFTSYEQFDKEIMNTKMRKKRAKLLGETNYRFKVVRGSESEDIYEQISHIHKLEKQYLQSEKGKYERKSLFENGNNEKFLKRLFKDNDQMVTFVLESEEGEIIVYKSCYLFGNVLYGWNTAYDPKYSHFHGIADVLMIEMIQYIFERGHGEKIDFGAGSYSWKFRWTNRFSVNYSLAMWNMSNPKTKFFRFLTRTREVVRAIRGITNEH